ncbi:MAG: hypothetical protein LBF36_02660 [Mycoplasmataceae bacterium]|jgi:hypothetical protein|nr:hypothetical protein [Mycoplasmataceae bacterium]
MKKFVTLITLTMASILLLSLTTTIGSVSSATPSIVNNSILIGFAAALTAVATIVAITQPGVNRIPGYVAIIAGVLSLLANAFGLVDAIQITTTYTAVVTALRPVIISFVSLSIIASILIPSVAVVVAKIHESK